jgi:2-keto-3-deoxy-L-rhamnonate aldolase RhmA
MNSESLQQALKQRSPVFGTLVVSPAPELVPVVAGMEIDYVFIDTEHIASDRRTLSWMCRAFSAAGVAPMVRIPTSSPDEASQAIDAGAAAVLAPYIETVEQVESLVGAVKQKPVKGKVLEQMLHDPEAHVEQRNYTLRHNSARSLLINIESVPAIEQLDCLLSVPGLDGIIIGPHDLSVSLGIPEEWTNPLFISAVDEILQKARIHGISAGIHHIFDGKLDQYVRRKDAGANIVLHSADILAFIYQMRRELTEIRGIMNTSYGSVS